MIRQSSLRFKNRRQQRISELNKSGINYFPECKRFDKNGNLIEILTSEIQMSERTNIAKSRKKIGKFTKKKLKSNCAGYNALAEITKEMKKEEKEGKHLGFRAEIRSRRKF